MTAPARQGFRMPAEWEPQEAIFLSWPVNDETWPGCFECIPEKFGEIAAAIARYERVRINCAADRQEAAWKILRRAGAIADRIDLYDHPTNDAWCRDHGPIFIRNDRTSEVAVTDWEYNAWGGKYPPFDDDNRIPGKVAEVLRLRRYANPMVLEGGSIEVDGQGQLLTTEACLLHKNRNPSLSRTQIEANLRDYFGVSRILWLGDGIAGDDTDGHIDDLARFYRPDAIVTVFEEDPADENYEPLVENWRRLREMKTPDGSPFELRKLPMPRPVVRDGDRLPASYANYLVINGAVLLPTFRQPDRDERAASIIRECFPGREVVPIDCVDLVLGLGALHCISQQQPA